MARKRKNKAVKQLVVLGLVLAAVQIAYIYLVPRAQKRSPREAIEQAVSRSDIDPKRREQLRIQLAVDDFQRMHDGAPPKTLDELVPLYFNVVPKNPDTGEAFAYSVKNGAAVIGDGGKAAAKTTEGNKTMVVPGEDDIESMSPEMREALIQSLVKGNESGEPGFVYDATGKRDPFRPFDFGPKVDMDPNKGPLERYDINQLKLTAVLGGGADDATATVENAAGHGFIVRKGVKIGLNSGEVTEIRADRIIIVESVVDFTGEKRTNTIELTLRTKDQEKKQRGGAKE